MGRKEKVTRIIDGDTFETNRRKNPVRLANADAPEKGQRGAPQARKDLGELIQGQEVYIDTVARDKYGRSVAKVKVERRSVNKAMKERLAAEHPLPFRDVNDERQAAQDVREIIYISRRAAKMKATTEWSVPVEVLLMTLAPKFYSVGEDKKGGVEGKQAAAKKTASKEGVLGEDKKKKKAYFRWGWAYFKWDLWINGPGPAHECYILPGV